MKRKILQQRTTFYVALPHEFLESNSLQKGDTVSVSEIRDPETGKICRVEIYPV